MRNRNHIYSELYLELRSVDYLKWKNYIKVRYNKKQLDDLRIEELEEFLILVKQGLGVPEKRK